MDYETEKITSMRHKIMFEIAGLIEKAMQEIEEKIMLNATEKFYEIVEKMEG